MIVSSWHSSQRLAWTSWCTLFHLGLSSSAVATSTKNHRPKDRHANQRPNDSVRERWNAFVNQSKSQSCKDAESQDNVNGEASGDNVSNASDFVYRAAYGVIRLDKDNRRESCDDAPVSFQPTTFPMQVQEYDVEDALFLQSSAPTQTYFDDSSVSAANFVEEQYFASLPDSPADIPDHAVVSQVKDKEPSTQPSELRVPSGMSYIDSQIFAIQCDLERPVGDWEAPYSALEYMRRRPPVKISGARSEVCKALQRKVVSEQDLVDQIGVSMDNRITVAADLSSNEYGRGSVTVNPNEEKFHNLTNNSSAHSDRVRPERSAKDEVIVNQKFLPEDINSLTSAELAHLLRRRILYNANGIVIINKPYGLVMHASESTPVAMDTVLSRLLKSEKGQPLDLKTVHRLDANTSGVTALAASAENKIALDMLFKKRMIHKVYWAVVRGRPDPPEGIIQMPIIERKQPNGRFRLEVSCSDQPGRMGKGLPAVTEYRTLDTKRGISLVEVRPITGYKHQIRVHMGLGMSCPVVGDHKYTYREAFTGEPQRLPGEALDRLHINQAKVRKLPMCLHAQKITIPGVFKDQTTDHLQDVIVTAPVPHHFNNIVRRLGLKYNL